MIHHISIIVSSEASVAFYEKLGLVKTVRKLDHLIVMKKEIVND